MEKTTSKSISFKPVKASLVTKREKKNAIKMDKISKQCGSFCKKEVGKGVKCWSRGSRGWQAAIGVIMSGDEIMRQGVPDNRTRKVGDKAFCNWNGKNLCYDIGGLPPSDVVVLSSLSEWANRHNITHYFNILHEK